jgi:hypothetical protein
MSKTAVGLFENTGVARLVVRDLHANAFPEKEIRILGEPLDMAVTGVTSTPRTDFEVGLNRELQAIGANQQEASAYTKGVREGGVLVFATGSSEAVANAATIMNRHGAIEVEELTGDAPNTAGLISEDLVPVRVSSVQTGRVREADGGGARLFVW